MQKNILHKSKKKSSGYTLVEVMVILFIFTTMFMTMLTVFQTAIGQLNTARAKIVAVDIANEQMEIIRNLTYAGVGTVNGSPQGLLADTRTASRSNITFTISTVIEYVDDPFDGCVGEVIGEPTKSQCADNTIVDKIRDIPANNNNPADYKKADVTVTWNSYYTGVPVKLSTIIAQKGLEGTTTKGFLLVKVRNAAGDPVIGAAVHVINSPTYDKTFSTDTFGNKLLLDMDPLSNYVIKVSKDEYSDDRTCTTDAAGSGCSDTEGNPDPEKKNITINQGQLEEATFFIDQLSTLAINSYNESCTPIPTIDFTLRGAKTISKPPSSILKNIFPFQTSGQGQWSKNDLEWDLYDLIVNTSGYDIAGINHDLSLNILPNTNTTLNVLLASHTTNSLLITVKDSSGTNLPGAAVRLTKAGYDETKITGHGFARQTDWSGGSGQTDFTDQTKYLSDDGHLDMTTTGQITLHKNSPSPFFTESFETTTYADTPNTTADWNTSDGELKLTSTGGVYPLNSAEHAQSATLNTQHGKIISATATATEELNDQTVSYSLSADGGLHFESIVLGTPYTFSNSGSDLRWRAELTTADENKTPKVKDITINYTVEYFDGASELVSSTFNLGSAATFTTLNWQPSSQPAETGSDSIKFQIATNNDNATWNFIGPDGTAATYYTTNNADLHDSHDGNQYLRYKTILSTSDAYYTSSLNDVRIGYTLACLPPGQTYFGNLDADAYTAEVSLSGYQTETQTIDVSGYTKQEIKLTAN